MQISKLVEQTINDGVALINSSQHLHIIQSIEYSTQPQFSEQPSKIKCFVGQLEHEGKQIETLGCIQTYFLPKYQKEKFVFLSESLDKFCANGGGFDFADGITKDEAGNEEKCSEKHYKKLTINDLINTYVWSNLRINVLSFYNETPAPRFLKRYFNKKYPMSTSVVLSQQLNKPLWGNEPGIEDFCFGFVDERHKRSIWAYGPGKFEKAIKHYSVSAYDEDTLQISLTAIISPRCERIMDIFGFDPIYFSVKVVDILTLKTFNIYKKFKNNIELQMMKHHAHIHEVMLNILFANKK